MLWSSGLLQVSLLVSIILINLCSFFVHFPVVFFLFVFCRYCLFSWPFSSFPLLFQFSIDILSSPKVSYYSLPTPLLSLYFLINSVLLVPFKFLTQDSGIGFLYLSLLVLLKFVGKIYSLWKISLIAQLVKNPPAMQVTPVQFLGCEDPLEKG